MRTLSHTEASAALDCQARHAFAYTGALTGGDILRKRDTAMVLRRGRAWGIAVAEFHASRVQAPWGLQMDRLADTTAERLERAHAALDEALDADTCEQIDAGAYDGAGDWEMRSLLRGALDHYAHTTDVLNTEGAEREVVVPLPSRTGGTSNAYRLRAFFDGVVPALDGVWLVEYKFRGALSSFEQIELDRQVRWYAWAYERETGTPVLGVLVDERKAEAPKPARMLKPGKDGLPKVSHATAQVTTVALYLDACRAAQDEPHAEVIEALRQRRWQVRHRIVFRPDEIAEVGRQLVSVGRLVHDLDTGLLYPVRNPSPFRCPGCPFRRVCADPSDVHTIDAYYERHAPKRLAEGIAA